MRGAAQRRMGQLSVATRCPHGAFRRASRAIRAASRDRRSWPGSASGVRSMRPRTPTALPNSLLQGISQGILLKTESRVCTTSARARWKRQAIQGFRGRAGDRECTVQVRLQGTGQGIWQRLVALHRQEVHTETRRHGGLNARTRGTPRNGPRANALKKTLAPLRGSILLCVPAPPCAPLCFNIRIDS
jgi:hypothetical protein